MSNHNKIDAVCRCGGHARLMNIAGRKSFRFYVQCAKCKVKTSAYNTKEEAIKSWNDCVPSKLYAIKHKADGDTWVKSVTQLKDGRFQIVFTSAMSKALKSSEGYCERLVASFEKVNEEEFEVVRIN